MKGVSAMKKIICVFLVLFTLTSVCLFGTEDFDSYAAENPMTISTTKKNYQVGEKIEVSYVGLVEDQGTDKRIEIRLDAGWNLKYDQDPSTRAGSYGFCDLIQDRYASTDVYEGTSGTKTFPDEDTRYINQVSTKWEDGVGYPAGKYTLWVFDYNYNGSMAFISNRIEITIGGPVLELSKTTYTEGEHIDVAYSGFVSTFWGKSFTQIDIFKKDDILGEDPCLAGHRIHHSDPAKTQSGAVAGEITFPANDTVREGQNFPLPAGDYFICLRADNTIVGDPIAFTVVAPASSATPSSTSTPASNPTPNRPGNTPTGDAAVWMIASLCVVFATVAIFIVKRRMSV